MTKRVAVLLAHGFEEGEAVVFIDIMRRLDIQVEILSCEESLALNSYFETPIRADALLADRQETLYDAVMMPGGPQGTDRLNASAMVLAFLRRHIAADKYICALCSSGAKVLAAHGLLEGRRYSTGDKLAERFADGEYVDRDVVVDGRFISAKGWASALNSPLRWRVTSWPTMWPRSMLRLATSIFGAGHCLKRN